MLGWVGVVCGEGEGEEEGKGGGEGGRLEYETKRDPS